MTDTTKNTNSGDRNSGNWNSGDLNSNEPPLRIFNRETIVAREDIVFPDFFFFDLVSWVDAREMTEQEKKDNDQYKVTGGFLRVLEYKEAWRKSWDAVTDGDRRKVLDLPNWDNAIFQEITGIDVEKELGVQEDKNAPNKEIEINGRTYRLVE